MKKILFGVIFLASAIAGGGIVWASSSMLNSSSTIKTSFFPSDVATKSSFACNALVATSVHGNVADKEVEGGVTTGTDTVALQILDESTLLMNTGANIGAGLVEGDKMQILENDDTKLIAVWYSGLGNGVISSIALNKTNGLAVWTKANSEFLLLGAPYGSAIYLKCL